MANVTFADETTSSNPAPRPLPRRGAGGPSRKGTVDDSVSVAPEAEATITTEATVKPEATAETTTRATTGGIETTRTMAAKSAAAAATIGTTITSGKKAEEGEGGATKTTVTEVPSMQASEPYVARTYGGSGINDQDFDRLIDHAERGESCCRCCGMRLGMNDLIRAVPIPIVAPIVAHIVAVEVPEDAEKMGVPPSVTDMMESQARCLCCLSLFWLPGIFVGACLKRTRLSPANILRTFRAVYANPALYNEAAKPMEAAEAFTRRMYGSKACC